MRSGAILILGSILLTFGVGCPIAEDIRDLFGDSLGDSEPMISEDISLSPAEAYMVAIEDFIAFGERFDAEYRLAVRELSSGDSCGLVAARSVSQLDTLCRDSEPDFSATMSRLRAFDRETTAEISTDPEIAARQAVMKERVDEMSAQLEGLWPIAENLLRRCPGERRRVLAALEQCRRFQ